MNKELLEISKNIKTQDNRITSYPMFVFQQLKRDWGYDEAYSDDFQWVNGDDSEEEADKERVEDLELMRDDFTDTAPWYKCYYKDRWEFVTACFTEKGCQNYLNRNKHNLGKTRIYVESGWRNDEYNTVRKMLMELEGD